MNRASATPARDPRSAARHILLATAILLALAIWLARDITLLVAYSLLLAYALLPVVRLLERIRWGGRHLPRAAAAGIVMLLLVSVVGWAVAAGVPRLVRELAEFAATLPETLTRVAEGARAYSISHDLGKWINPLIDSLPKSPAALVKNVISIGGPWAAGMFGGLGRVFALLLLPLLAFYLLADSDEVRDSLLRFAPEDARAQVAQIGNSVDRALRRYVRGQAIVSLTMGVLVGIALAILQLPLVLLLAVIVAIAEVVPYLGFLVAAIAIGIAGLSVSPMMALSGLVAYTVVNWMVASFVTPRVMGRYLEMHPFVVTVAVLAGATLLGPPGALLALPGTAALQAVMGDIASDPPADPKEPSLPPPASTPTHRSG